MKVVVTNALGGALIQILIALSIAFMIYLATDASIAVSAGGFVAILVAMIRLLQPMRRLNQVNGMVQRGLSGADSVFKLLDLPGEDDLGERTLDISKGHIEYQAVDFSYPGSNQFSLKNLNFTVMPGQSIAVVGRSGGGKSTLIHLLLGFYKLTGGSILLDGHDIRSYRLLDWRKQFSLVSQHIFLFHDSIANNIAYGQLGTVSRDDIIRAAEAAQVMEFAAALPEGLDTNIGADGFLLSGGQRQRIAIARALLKNAPILILDEATSALDSHSESIIQQALALLIQGRTSFIIAHRLSTIEKADKILVLDNGRIIETGKHQELLQQGGSYAQLCALQYGQDSPRE